MPNRRMNDKTEKEIGSFQDRGFTRAELQSDSVQETGVGKNKSMKWLECLFNVGEKKEKKRKEKERKKERKEGRKKENLIPIYTRHFHKLYKKYDIVQ
jgi:hypothetical protein